MLLKSGIYFGENDRFYLEKLLGRGGFSEVWLVKDMLTNKHVALKVYASSSELDEEGLELFIRELSIVHGLHHTNLLTPSIVDSWQNMPYLVMSYCKNGSCKKYIGNFSEEQTITLLQDVSSGLAYLHDHDIIHQDIKPDNILIDDDGNYVITDFGISTRAYSTLTKSSQFQNSGTIAYMGPERFGEVKNSVKASDIWSLGATIYELIEGTTPFLPELGGLAQKNGATIPEFNANISNKLKKCILSLLSRKTWDRPKAIELTNYKAYTKKNRHTRRIVSTMTIILLIGVIMFFFCQTLHNTSREIELWEFYITKTLEHSSIDNLKRLSAACCYYFEHSPTNKHSSMILSILKFKQTQVEVDNQIDKKISGIQDVIEKKEARVRYIAETPDNDVLQNILIKKDSLNRFFLEKIGHNHAELIIQTTAHYKENSYTFDCRLAYEQAKRELSNRRYELATKYIDYAITEHTNTKEFLALKADIEQAKQLGNTTFPYTIKTSPYHDFIFYTKTSIPVFSSNNCVGVPNFYLYKDQSFKVKSSTTVIQEAAKLKVTKKHSNAFAECRDNGIQPGDYVYVLAPTEEGYWLVLHQGLEKDACFAWTSNGKATIRYDGCNMIEGDFINEEEVSETIMNIQLLNEQTGYIRLINNTTLNKSIWDYVYTWWNKSHLDNW